jgi:outer membrane lipoprotein-sorting protein
MIIMMNKTLVRIFISILLLAVSVSAQDKGRDLLGAVQKKYNSLHDFSAGFKQVLNDKTSLAGKVYYAKGNKYKMELINSTIISDGITIWNYNKKQKKVVINNASESEQNFSIDNILNDYPSKSAVTLEKEDNLDVLVLIPLKDKYLNFKKASITIKPDFLIERVLIENVSAGNSVLRFSDYKLDQNLSDSMFSFSPPEGTTVIDLRK